MWVYPRFTPEEIAELERIGRMTPEEREAFWAQFTPKCARCVFVRRLPDIAGLSHPWCHRNPEPVSVTDEHWCGEYAENKMAQPRRPFQ